MSRDSLAASTISGVRVWRSLTAWTRSIWVRRRSTRRKVPAVMRTMVAMAVAWAIPPVVRVGVGGEPACEDGGELVGCERVVFVGESDAAVELGVAREALFDAGHADEDRAHGVPVVIVPHLFEAGGLEPVGFVDDEQLGAAAACPQRQATASPATGDSRVTGAAVRAMG